MEERALFSCYLRDVSHKGIFVATTKEIFSFLLVLPDFVCVTSINFVMWLLELCVWYLINYHDSENMFHKFHLVKQVFETFPYNQEHINIFETLWQIEQTITIISWITHGVRPTNEKCYIYVCGTSASDPLESWGHQILVGLLFGRTAVPSQLTNSVHQQDSIKYGDISRRGQKTRLRIKLENVNQLR